MLNVESDIISLHETGHMRRAFLLVRHPEPSSRPAFTNILEFLTRDKVSLQSWQEVWQEEVKHKPLGKENSNVSAVTQYVIVENQPRLA